MPFSVIFQCCLPHSKVFQNFLGQYIIICSNSHYQPWAVSHLFDYLGSWDPSFPGHTSLCVTSSGSVLTCSYLSFLYSNALPVLEIGHCFGQGSWAVVSQHIWTLHFLITHPTSSSRSCLCVSKVWAPWDSNCFLSYAISLPISSLCIISKKNHNCIISSRNYHNPHSRPNQVIFGHIPTLVPSPVSHHSTLPLHNSSQFEDNIYTLLSYYSPLMSFHKENSSQSSQSSQSSFTSTETLQLTHLHQYPISLALSQADVCCTVTLPGLQTQLKDHQLCCNPHQNNHVTLAAAHFLDQSNCSRACQTDLPKSGI